MKRQAKQGSEQDVGSFDDRKESPEREPIERNVGLLEDKEKFKANNNNLPEDEPTKQIRKGVRTDNIPAATRLPSSLEKENTVLEKLPAEADLIRTESVIAIYVD